MLKKLFEPKSVDSEDPGSSPQHDEQAKAEILDEAILTHAIDEDDGTEEDEVEIGELPFVAEPAQASDPQLEASVAAVRNLILSLHRGIVPEMIGGETVEAVISSIVPAQNAFNRVVSGLSIPAGGNPSVTLDVESIPTFDKIRRGLSTSRS